MISSFKYRHKNIGVQGFCFSTFKLKIVQVNHMKESKGGGHRVGTQKKWPHWAQALHDVAFHPDKYKEKVLQVTDEAVVYPDLYPKGKKHLLVISRMNGLDSLADVRKEHFQHLQHIHNLGEEWVENFLKEDPSMIFRLGYHSVPSMRQLHMHVISQDFDSHSLKNATHWNSSMSPFFLDSKRVMTELESNGKITTCTKEEEVRLLKSPLRCHRCRMVHKDMMHLKDHIRICTMPLPQDLIPYIYTSSLSSHFTNG